MYWPSDTILPAMPANSFKLHHTREALPLIFVCTLLSKHEPSRNMRNQAMIISTPPVNNAHTPEVKKPVFRMLEPYRKSSTRIYLFFFSLAFRFCFVLSLSMPLHISGSTLSPSRWQQLRLLSSSWQRRERGDHRGWGRREGPGWKAGSSESAVQATSYL